MATKTVPVTEARKKFTELIKEVEDMMGKYIITRKGKPAAVILNTEEFESLQETIRIMEDQLLQEKLRQARADITDGEIYSYEEIFGEPLHVQNSSDQAGL